MSLSGNRWRLIEAVEQGDVDGVKELVENNYDINELSDSGCSAVLVAVMTNRHEILNYLIEKGAYVPEKHVTGRDLIEYAKRQCSFEVVKMLQESLKKKQHKKSQTPCHLDNITPIECDEVINSESRPVMRK